MKNTLCLAALLLATLPGRLSRAAEPVPLASEAEQLRQELRQLRQQYEQQIQRLEQRLLQLEAAQAGRTNLSPAAGEEVQSPTKPTPSAQARQYAEQQFQRDTESRQRAVLKESAPWRDRAEQVLQDFLDIHGYFRAGYGRNNQGEAQTGFQAPGAFAKYRLGNEAENYGEVSFGKNFYVPDLFKLDAPPRPSGEPSGPIARVQTTMSIYNPYSDSLSAASTDFALPEAWASVGNVVAAQPTMKVWAGNRYYRRHDIHITDFYFYNMSGSGGGIEDVQTPFGKMALGWVGSASTSGFSDLPEPDPSNQAGFSKGNWDLRLYDVPLPLGKGEFGVVYANTQSGQDADGNSAPNGDGVALTAMHTREGFLSQDGINKLSLQFGTGPAKTFTSGFETTTLPSGVFIRSDSDNSWRFRATEHFVANLNEHLSLGPALLYQITDYGSAGGMVQWGSAGIRPIVHFNRHFSLAFEGGIDWVKDDDQGSNDYLYKLTLAPQVSLGNRFMSRPVIRAYVTFAQWGSDFRGLVGGSSYSGEDWGVCYGVQMEAWW